MNRKRMIYIGTIALFALAGMFAWNMMARAAYESAEYKVIESDGKFEVREYPDLMLVATTTKLDAQGRGDQSGFARRPVLGRRRLMGRGLALC